RSSERPDCETIRSALFRHARPRSTWSLPVALPYYPGRGHSIVFRRDHTGRQDTEAQKETFSVRRRRGYRAARRRERQLPPLPGRQRTSLLLLSLLKFFAFCRFVQKQNP